MNNYEQSQQANNKQNNSFPVIKLKVKLNRIKS